MQNIEAVEVDVVTKISPSNRTFAYHRKALRELHLELVLLLDEAGLLPRQVRALEAHHREPEKITESEFP